MVGQRVLSLFGVKKLNRWSTFNPPLFKVMVESMINRALVKDHLAVNFENSIPLSCIRAQLQLKNSPNIKTFPTHYYTYTSPFHSNFFPSRRFRLSTKSAKVWRRRDLKSNKSFSTVCFSFLYYFMLPPSYLLKSNVHHQTSLKYWRTLCLWNSFFFIFSLS